MATMSRDGVLPRSRRYLAVPFVGKDTPSPSSEYAHPDVAIGLTILAYRYAGWNGSRRACAHSASCLFCGMFSRRAPCFAFERLRRKAVRKALGTTATSFEPACIRLSGKSRLDECGQAFHV
eukprot:6208794-Pleurochrysis_carterae.AAC.2